MQFVFLKKYSLVEIEERYANSMGTNSTKDEEGVDLFCSNCNLEFTSFSFRNFIKLRGFKEFN